LGPGAILRNKQSIVSIDWTYIIPEFPLTAAPEEFAGLYSFDAAFYGFYTNAADRATTDVTQGSITGSTLISFTRKTYTDVNEVVTGSVDIDSVSTAQGSRPFVTSTDMTKVGFPNATLPDGRTGRWYSGSFILIPDDMVTRTVKEVVQWTVLDVLSAIGGFYAIIGTFIVTFHGESYFRDPGLLRKIFYGVPSTQSAAPRDDDAVVREWIATRSGEPSSANRSDQPLSDGSSTSDSSQPVRAPHPVLGLAVSAAAEGFK